MFKVSWFQELLPNEKIVEEKILDIIKKSYKQVWFTQIETPAVERNSVLTAKWGGEVSKQIFWLYGLAQWCEDTKDYSLHFDLTVPFARYVLDHKNELTFPFKRSQIQKVWRWERAQKGRFREFYQADIDVIWDDKNSNNQSKNVFYDAEVIFVIINTLKNIFSEFNLDKQVFVNVNHKKIIAGFFEYLWLVDKLTSITILIDKKDKISPEAFVEWLEKLEISKEKIDQIVKFTEWKIEDLENIENDLLQEWISELKQILNYLEVLWVNVKVNLAIMRGLDYYTWIVFETFVDGERSLGSIASGGRYEKLTHFIDPKTEFSGVGGSIGVSRLESYLLEVIEAAEQTSSECLLINFQETEKEILKLYQKLLQEWKKVEFYPESVKLAKQFKYADKKWIANCIILWEGELKNWKYKIKNMESWQIQENIF